MIDHSMYNITLISTRHQPLGECNSFALQQIILDINPEIAFLEAPPNHIKKEAQSNLEEFTIGMCSVTHRLKCVPVDSDDVPAESFFQNLKNLHIQIEDLDDINGTNYRNFIDKHKKHVELHGFSYLNSIECVDINDEINNAIERGLERINNVELFQIWKLWKSVNEKREHEMLRNIYQYSNEHSYGKAIFTLGSAHRKSIMRKIEEYEREEKLKLNWAILGSF